MGLLGIVLGFGTDAMKRKDGKTDMNTRSAEAECIAIKLENELEVAVRNDAVGTADLVVSPRNRISRMPWAENPPTASVGSLGGLVRGDLAKAKRANSPLERQSRGGGGLAWVGRQGK